MKKMNIVYASTLYMCALSTNAAMVQLAGADVTFTYDDSTMYGPANVVGNSITFSPSNFLAESIQAGIVSSLETLNIGIEVNTGSNFVIGSLGIAEAGDYKLNNSYDAVSAEGRLQVKSLTTQCGLFACENSEIFTAGVLSNVGSLTQWSANSLIDFSWGSDTWIQAQIQNDLEANSSLADGGRAFIQKKSGGIGLIVMPEVPIPASLWLFGSAVIGLVAAKRNK